MRSTVLGKVAKEQQTHKYHNICVTFQQWKKMSQLMMYFIYLTVFFLFSFSFGILQTVMGWLSRKDAKAFCGVMLQLFFTRIVDNTITCKDNDIKILRHYFAGCVALCSCKTHALTHTQIYSHSTWSLESSHWMQRRWWYDCLQNELIVSMERDSIFILIEKRACDLCRMRMRNS